jgi:hypothetical protein
MFDLKRHIMPAAAAGLLLISNGCGHKNEHLYVEPPAPLGSISDDIWQKQEENAEASDFVIYEHEFIGNTTRLNDAGERHVKQIAARAGQVPFPVMVEPSSMSRRPGDKYGYPVHGNEKLDMKRRELIVKSLTSMGVQDAEARVVVSPALAPGFEEFEAERAYQTGFNGGRDNGTRSFGFGGGFGGFGGFFGF